MAGALLDDIAKAQRALLDRRVALLSALENVRLALVRFKSGLGHVDGVERELGEARRLLEQKPA